MVTAIVNSKLTMKNHEFTKNGKKYICLLCNQEWDIKPATQCYGVSVYKWNERPECLLTITELRQLRLKPIGAPKGVYIRLKTPHEVWFYDKSETKEFAKRSFLQLQATRNMNKKNKEKNRCNGCGMSGDSKSNLLHKILEQGYCLECQAEFNSQSISKQISKRLQNLLTNNTPVLIIETEAIWNGEERRYILTHLEIINEKKHIFNSFIQSKENMKFDTRYDALSRELIENIDTGEPFLNIWEDLETKLSTSTLFSNDPKFVKNVLMDALTENNIEVPKRLKNVYYTWNSIGNIFNIYNNREGKYLTFWDQMAMFGIKYENNMQGKYEILSAIANEKEIKELIRGRDTCYDCRICLITPHLAISIYEFKDTHKRFIVCSDCVEKRNKK